MADNNNIFLFVPNLIGTSRFTFSPISKGVLLRSEKLLEGHLKRFLHWCFLLFLIGYARVVLGVLSLYFMATNHVAAALLYIISGLLDAFDGYAARALDQSITLYDYYARLCHET